MCKPKACQLARYFPQHDSRTYYRGCLTDPLHPFNLQHSFGFCICNLAIRLGSVDAAYEKVAHEKAYDARALDA